MAIRLGDCEGCKRKDIEVFDNISKCIICARLDNIEEVLEGIFTVDSNERIQELTREIVKERFPNDVSGEFNNVFGVEAGKAVYTPEVQITAIKRYLYETLSGIRK